MSQSLLKLSFLIKNLDCKLGKSWTYSLMWQNSFKGKKMFSSVIEMEFKAGMMAKALEIAEQMRPEFADLGCNQFLMINKGNDEALVLAIYESEEKQQAALPKAQELLGRLKEIYASMPERQGGNVIINEVY